MREGVAREAARERGSDGGGEAIVLVPCMELVAEPEEGGEARGSGCTVWDSKRGLFVSSGGCMAWFGVR